MSVSKIEWVLNPDGVTHGWSWSPVVGCRHNCSYCAAREIARRFPALLPNTDLPGYDALDKCIQCQTFEPHTHWERELPKFRKPTTVFIGFMCDLWGDWVPEEWIQRVIAEVKARPETIFLTLTKNPKRYEFFPQPRNLWRGITVTTREQANRTYWDVDVPCRQFLSFEPVLEEVAAYDNFITIVRMSMSIIVGPLNHRGPAVTRREWIEHIIEAAEAARVPVFMKNACLKPRAFVDGKCFTESEMRRELPWVT